MSMAYFVLAGMAGALAVLGVVWMIRVHVGMGRRIVGLGTRISRLEECQGKRLPHKTAAGVEDAQAVGIDLVHLIEATELDLAALKFRAGQQMDILSRVRQGPEGYDVDRPCGRRLGRMSVAEEIERR